MLARISIYLTDELKARMDLAGNFINWSEVVRPAINDALEDFEQGKGVDDFDLFPSRKMPSLTSADYD